jgi:hypothetical protein
MINELGNFNYQGQMDIEESDAEVEYEDFLRFANVYYSNIIRIFNI